MPIHEVAYRWDDEKFTRLIPGLLSDKKKCSNLFIHHHPIKQLYKNPREYRKNLLPLIEEEWFYISSIFKNENTGNGFITTCEKICYTDEGKKILYAVHLLIPRNRTVWENGNPSCVTSSTLYFNVKILFY